VTFPQRSPLQVIAQGPRPFLTSDGGGTGVSAIGLDAAGTTTVLNGTDGSYGWIIRSLTITGAAAGQVVSIGDLRATGFFWGTVVGPASTLRLDQFVPAVTGGVTNEVFLYLNEAGPVNAYVTFDVLNEPYSIT
jgi:hypothetical protein